MKYDKENNTSFSLGMFPTMELIKNQPSSIVAIYYSNKINKNTEFELIQNFCLKNNIQLLERTKFIENLSGKDNVFIVGEFQKRFSSNNNLSIDKNHLALVNPSDMGNLGTIMRTSLGFGITNIAIIKPCADIFNPKVVRASMGAIFSLNIWQYESFDEYAKANNCIKYVFCLEGKDYLQNLKINRQENYALVFGNEATGLTKDIITKGLPIKIKQDTKIDSFNLAISVGIALYEFTK